MMKGFQVDVAFTDTSLPLALTYDEQLGANANLLQWLVLDAGRVTLNSGRVAQITDRSAAGKIATQASAGAQPQYYASGGPNDRGFMTLDNTRSDRMSTAVSVPTGSGAKFTKISLVKPPAEPTSGAYHDIMSGNNLSSTSVGVHRVAVRGTNQFEARVGITTAIAFARANMTPDAWQLVVSTWNGPTNTVRIGVNGGAWASSTVAGAQCDEAAMNIGSVSNVSTFIGGIADTMLWNIDLSESENASVLAVVKQYFRDRYSLPIS